MKRELIIHPGLPKTGTTTLQNRLFQTHPEYLYLGKFNNGTHYEADDIPRDQWLVRLKRDLVSKQLSYFQAVDIDDILHKEFGDQYFDYSRLFLSEEDIFARCLSPGQYDKLVRVGSAYDIVDKIKILGDHSSFDRIKIILTIRRQEDLIESYFAEEYQNYSSFFGMKSPDQFVDYLLQEGAHEEADALLRYDHIVAHLDDTFGRENVLVLPYEKFKVDPEEFLHEISAFLNISPWKDSRGACKAKDNNRDASDRIGKIAKVRPLRNKLVEVKQKLIGNIPTGFGHSLSFLDRFQKERVVGLCEEYKGKVRKHYKESNIDLARRVQGLSRYGYYDLSRLRTGRRKLLV